MAYAPFHVTITNVAGALYEGSVTSMSLPGAEGDMVVLAHHEPIIALLKNGTIKIETESGEEKKFPIVSGVLEVSHNKAIVLLK
jgi:F-type H+-transporting ATPase subunit epsilon